MASTAALAFHCSGLRPITPDERRFLNEDKSYFRFYDNLSNAQSYDSHSMMEAVCERLQTDRDFIVLGDYHTDERPLEIFGYLLEHIPQLERVLLETNILSKADWRESVPQVRERLDRSGIAVQELYVFDPEEELRHVLNQSPRKMVVFTGSSHSDSSLDEYFGLLDEDDALVPQEEIETYRSKDQSAYFREIRKYIYGTVPITLNVPSIILPKLRDTIEKMTLKKGITIAHVDARKSALASQLRFIQSLEESNLRYAQRRIEDYCETAERLFPSIKRDAYYQMREHLYVGIIVPPCGNCLPPPHDADVIQNYRCVLDEMELRNAILGGYRTRSAMLLTNSQWITLEKDGKRKVITFREREIANVKEIELRRKSSDPNETVAPSTNL